MEIDIKTAGIILAVLFGGGSLSSVATMAGVAGPKIEQAEEKMSFAQDQLQQCLERLEQCHKDSRE